MMRPVARHSQFFIAAAVGVVIFVVARSIPLDQAATLGADAFFLTYSALILAKIPSLTPEQLRAHARSDDLPVLLIFAVTLLIVGVAAAALFTLINAPKNPTRLDLMLALLSLPLGWFTIHAMAALHYAHIFWEHADKASKSASEPRPAGGLDFPGEAAPNGFDFLYFAATIGMTAQTADVGITSSKMRHAVLLHAIVSFFFNTVIVAAAVNLAVSLGN